MKTLRTIFAFLLIGLLLTSCVPPPENGKYSIGKDTVASFCDGRFQLLRGYDATKTNEVIDLFDLGASTISEEIIAKNVVAYKKTKDYGYFIDVQGRYILLDITQNKISSISTEINTFTDEQQRVFLRLKK